MHCYRDDCVELDKTLGSGPLESSGPVVNFRDEPLAAVFGCIAGSQGQVSEKQSDGGD